MHGLFTSFLFGFLSVQLVAQDLDSVHVFKWQPDGQQTLASAHTLAWRLHLERAPHTTLQGEELTTVAEVEVKPGVGITKSALTLTGNVPGMSAADFSAAADKAKAGCPVSKALAAIEITLDAKLEG